MKITKKIVSIIVIFAIFALVIVLLGYINKLDSEKYKNKLRRGATFNAKTKTDKLKNNSNNITALKNFNVELKKAIRQL